MHLQTRLYQWIEKSLGWRRHRAEPGMLLGRRYILINGKFRAEDYDDAWLLALAAEARTVFDIGCNIGHSTLLCLHPGRVQEILAVDPNPRALASCAEHLILNSLSEKARFIGAFVGDRVGDRIEFYTVGTGAAGSMHKSHARTAGSIGSRSVVNTVTIDSLGKRYELDPDLVKIDTEGAETLVLAGAADTARKGRARFLVEMHDTEQIPMLENARRVLRWTSLVGYSCWYLKEMKILENPETIAHRGRCHLLLLPMSEGLPERLCRLRQSSPLTDVLLD